jgi:hypothetical protein
MRLLHRLGLSARSFSNLERVRHHAVALGLFSSVNFVALFWIILVYWNERTVFTSAVQLCAWEQWEQWVRVPLSCTTFGQVKANDFV